MQVAEVSSRRRAASAGVTILVALSAAICGLCVWQWVVQSRLRQLIEAERQATVVAEKKFSDQEAQAKRYSEEITRLEALRKDLEESTKTNRTELSRVRAELSKISFSHTNLTKELELYKEALTNANHSIEKQNAAITSQNENFKKLVDERNEFVTKYNKTVTIYNTLVDQVKKEREAQAAAAAAEKDKK
jgi:chromosome segregation ATPase